MTFRECMQCGNEHPELMMVSFPSAGTAVGLDCITEEEREHPLLEGLPRTSDVMQKMYNDEYPRGNY